MPTILRSTVLLVAMLAMAGCGDDVVLEDNASPAANETTEDPDTTDSTDESNPTEDDDVADVADDAGQDADTDQGGADTQENTSDEGDDEKGGTGDVSAVVAEAGEVMSALDTMYFTTEIAAGDDATTSEGAIDRASDLLQMKMETPGGEVTVVVDGDTTFQQMPDGTWVTADEMLFDDGFIPGVDFFEETWESLVAPDDVVEVGEDEVNGEPTTQFEVAAENELDPGRESLVSTVWINDNGFIVRQEAEMEFEEGNTVSTVNEYYDFGEPVEVTLPDEDDVEDWGDL